MTQTQTGDTRAATIKKLLNKAEARGVTEAERDAYNAMATKLMIKWGIEEAMLADADRAAVENIVQRIFSHDTPKSYSYEITLIGIEVAKQMSCRGLLQRNRDGRTDLLLVGFESDVELVLQLFVSLIRQCNQAMLIMMPGETAWAAMSGTLKYNWKKSFIRGFAKAVGTKLAAIRNEAVEESTPGTDLMLVDRTKKVDAHIAANMRTGRAVARRYQHDGVTAGRDAGARADVGQTAMGGARGKIGG